MGLIPNFNSIQSNFHYKIIETTTSTSTTAEWNNNYNEQQIDSTNNEFGQTSNENEPPTNEPSPNEEQPPSQGSISLKYGV